MIPIILKPDGARRCLVVGGGRVALRKVQWLLEGGARVEVVSPALDGALEALARERPEAVTLSRAQYAPGGDLKPYLLAIAATDDASVNRAVAADARRDGVPVNVVDVPDLCTFYVPATARRGDLLLAVSTGGACPSLARVIREELETRYPAWYGAYVAALGRVRREMLAAWPPEETHRVLARLASRELAERLATADAATLAQRIRDEAERLRKEQTL